MKKILDNNIILTLRENNVITKNEVAYQHGDLFIAEDVLSGNKRNIDISRFLNENNSNKRILKG